MILAFRNFVYLNQMIRIAIRPLGLFNMKKALLFLCWLGLWQISSYAQNEPKLENLGNKVNSTYDDLAPVVTPDGKTLYFTRKNHPGNQFGVNGTEDTWVSTYNPETKSWTEAQNLGKSFNSQRINGIQSISPDGNSILIFGAYEDGTYKEVGFSVRERTEEGWSSPQKLQIEGLTAMVKGIFLGAYMANNGQVMILYFSETPGSRSNDLYVSKKKDDGSWGRPQNMGRVVNSTASDASPFIAADNTSLYFASNRPGGQGGFDIYRTRRLDDTWLNWSIPENLGPSINTAGFEANYTIPASGEHAYMSSETGSMGRSDIVRVKLDAEVQPDPVALVFGTVMLAETNIPVSANIRVYSQPENKDEGGVRAFSGNGKYQTTMPVGKSYLVIANKAGYRPDTAIVDLAASKNYVEIRKDFSLLKEASGRSVSAKPSKLDTRLSTVYFEVGKIALSPATKRELDRMYTLMTENPDILVIVEGHTDNEGGYDANQKLSEYRVRAARAYLIAKGIAPSRLNMLYFGYTNPADSNRTQEGRANNRRVELHLWVEQF